MRNKMWTWRPWTPPFWTPKRIVWAGVVIIVLMCFFPPWSESSDGDLRGYACILSNPRWVEIGNYGPNHVGGVINTTRLTLQCVIVVLLTGCLYWTVKSKKNEA
ncbi:MAG TPA: hypothetical protein VNA25_21035 [Phycisphaerae bacterium]|nr:hypothetical protein [Phycisphaerae bacterium]